MAVSVPEHWVQVEILKTSILSFNNQLNTTNMFLKVLIQLSRDCGLHFIHS